MGKSKSTSSQKTKSLESQATTKKTWPGQEKDSKEKDSKETKAVPEGADVVPAGAETKPKPKAKAKGKAKATAKAKSQPSKPKVVSKLAKTVIKSAMKKQAVAKKQPMKSGKPSSSQSLPTKAMKSMKKPAGLALKLNEEPMSLNEKIELFMKKPNGDIKNFLDELGDDQRQALWQRFSQARTTLKDPKMDQAWTEAATGPGSADAKRRLLKIFLKSNQELKNSQAYVTELTQLTKIRGERTESSWVPFQEMQMKYGLAELTRRIKRGTIVARTALDDEEEYEFKLIKRTAFDEETHKQEMQGHQVSKIDAENWIKMKTQAMTGFQAQNENALDALCLNSNQARKNLKPKTELDSDADEDMAQSDDDPDVFKAETLSVSAKLGGKPMDKVDNMHRLLTKLLKSATSVKAKKLLVTPMQQLDQLKAKAAKTKPKFEDIKDVLLDCAVAVNHYKKLKAQQ